ncbi:unnamed protein product [Enterobius vermicularis]|uniref:Sec3-PIP2_bind domain-containing protein n=1 Tax=Enterobius vermicularis TaxID=51028 RepID=A0A0N4VHM7_ENTVE|nr:unnamed protein product [Enterobius vermicularis]
MRAIVSNLQRAVFSDDERLVAVANIIRPISVRLYFVKKEKDDCFKKKECFSLRDVKVIDGINPRKLTPEFEVTVEERCYKLCTSSAEEKDAFIKQLYKFASKYLPVQKPDFVNVPIPVDTPSSSVVVEHSDEAAEDNLADYQPISVKEEADFRRLLARANLTVGETDKFALLLGEQLQSLDGANIQSIMDSENAVNDLIALIDSALEKVDSLMEILEAFDKLLYHVRDSVELIEEKDSLGSVERRNMRMLKDYMDESLNIIGIVTDEHISTLQSANLSDPTGINRCCTATRAVQTFFSSKLPPPMRLMRAYKERSEMLTQLVKQFTEKLAAHLSGLFLNLSELSETQEWHEVALRKQSERFHALRPYSELVGWIQATNPAVYQTVVQRYVQNVKILYKKDFDRFFDVISLELSKLVNSDKSGTSKGLDTSRASLELSFHADSSIDSKSVLSIVEIVLGEISSVVESEQKFCSRFFHISGDLLTTIETQSTSSGESGGTGKAIEKQIADKMKSVLTPLFEPLHEHLDKFIKQCCRMHAMMVFTLFVFLSKKALSFQDCTSYFSVMIFGRLVVLVKRQLDSFMDDEARFLSDVRFYKKTRIGVLSNLEHFNSLALSAEAAFSETERRADLDRWYLQLISSLKEGIEKAAVSPNSKSPASVVRIENYHPILSELKIECLDSQRKEAKKAYQESIQMYVRDYMGRPLEKLHTFFEGVENAVKQGVKPEEIAFQQQFSRSELKKVISIYPGKEVRKGLEQLYKKIEKHLIENSPLLQVIWRNMQDEFLKQLKHYQEVIGQCYPNSRIDLEVSIQDVLNYFSQFAQEH